MLLLFAAAFAALALRLGSLPAYELEECTLLAIGLLVLIQEGQFILVELLNPRSP